VLNGSHFSDPRHRIIFGKIKTLFDSDEPFGLPDVHAALDADELERVGGASYLSSIVDALNFSQDLNHHAHRLVSVAAIRQIQSFAEGLLIKTQDFAQMRPSETCDTAIDQLSKISMEFFGGGDGITERKAAIELMQSLEETNPRTIYTGIDKLDEITGGFRPGEVVIFTAQTGVGKTFLALQTKRTSCRSHKHGLFCSGEMLAPHLKGRDLATESGVAYFKIRNPRALTSEDYSALAEATGLQCPTCEILDGDLTLPRLRMRARMLKARGVLDCVYVDYDELVEVQGEKNEWDEGKKLMRSMASLAKELRVPVVIISQQRKLPSQDTAIAPRLADLYGSGAKSKHATFVIYVDRPFVQTLEGDETEARLYILKSREGRMGVIECEFNLKTFEFRSVDKLWSNP